VRFAAIILYVASQGVFVVVVVYFVMTQSGNFWINPRIRLILVHIDSDPYFIKHSENGDFNHLESKTGSLGEPTTH